MTDYVWLICQGKQEWTYKSRLLHSHLPDFDSLWFQGLPDRQPMPGWIFENIHCTVCGETKPTQRYGEHRE